MRAFFLEKQGSPEKAFRLKEVAEPNPGPGDCLIRVEAFGLNYADVMARKGAYRDAPPLPCVLGYDVVGRVVQAPEGASVKAGDRVVALTRFGGYADWAVARAEAVFKIGEEVPAPEATALATQGATAWHCALGTGSLHSGDWAIVSAAAGGVGSLLVQICKVHGLQVAGLAGPSKKSIVVKLGADIFLDRTQGSLFQLWKKHGAGIRPDVIFDSVGGSQARQALHLLNKGGRVVLYGAAGSRGSRNPLSLLSFAWGFGVYSPIPFILRSQSLVGVNMLRLADYKPRHLQKALRGALDLYQNGLLKPLPGHVFPHTELSKAHALLESGLSAGKIAVVWA